MGIQADPLRLFSLAENKSRINTDLYKAYRRRVFGFTLFFFAFTSKNEDLSFHWTVPSSL